MAKSAAVERWFASTKPPSEAALRRVREIILGAVEHRTHSEEYSGEAIGSAMGIIRLLKWIS